ncbi:MAG: FHA domain-containing protein [Caldisericia bacterium]|nr:FHA domain-containing protein [Caldisericia bacterium]
MNPNLSINNALFGISSFIATYAVLCMVVFIFAVLNYVIISYALYKISEFLDHPFPWIAWFPAYKILLITQLSEKPWWWLFFFYLAPVILWIPILGWIVLPILLLILLCIMLAEILNKIEQPSWWCILFILPIVNLVIGLVVCNELNNQEKPGDDLEFSLPDNNSMQDKPRQNQHINQYNIPKGTEATLVVIQGESTGKGFRLDKNTVHIIGRAGNIALPMNDKTASREHARIRYENDKFVIYDLGSTNKTRVNNQIISRKVLMNGDEIKTGKILFKFQWKRL